MKRLVYVLIGPPAVGKSTWINKMTHPHNTFVINRDDIVEDVAATYSWSYEDLYANPPEDAEIGEVDEKYGEVVPAPEYMHWRDTAFNKVLEANEKVLNKFHEILEKAKNTDKNVIIDMTNMRVKDRLDLLERVERPGDIRIAVIFKFEGQSKLFQKVAEKRAEIAARMGKSKTIPPAAIERMISGYEPPSQVEKYDKIIHSDTIKDLKKFAGLNEIRKIIRKVINEIVVI